MDGLMSRTHTPSTSSAGWAGCRRCLSASFTTSRSFYTSTSSTTSVRADFSILVLIEDIRALWSQKLVRHRDTTLFRYPVYSGRQSNAMSPYWIGQARHTHSVKFRENKKKQTTSTSTYSVPHTWHEREKRACS